MKRISYFDIVRGIGICLSVLGHCCITELRNESVITQSLYDGIYFFHMSLFFFLAGTLYGKKGITKMSGTEKLQYIRKKFCSLGIPYLFYSFGGYAIYVVLKKKTLSASLIEIFTTENHIFHHIWFLYVMFFVSIIVIFLNRKMRLAATVISGGAFIVISFLPGTTLISLYLTKYLFFYLVGILYWEKDQIFVQNRFRTILRILLFAGMDILYVAQYAGVPDLNGFPLIINRVICCSLMLIGGIAGNLLLFQLSAWLDKVRKGGLLEMFGNRSMAIYLFHMPVLVPVLGKLLYHFHVNGVVLVVVCFVIGIAVPLLLEKIVDRFKLLRLLLLGKN